MKKIFASILLLVYFVTSTGFVVSVHYCMDKIDSMQWGDSSSDTCSKCGMHMEENSGCCKDDVKVIKMNVDQAVAKWAVANFSFVKACVFTQVTFLPLPPNIYHQDFSVTHSPPLFPQGIYLQNCVFRI